MDIPRIALGPAAGPPSATALKAWQVGQVLQLMVVEVTAPGRATLMIAGQRCEAQTDATLTPGQRLRVRVETSQAPQVLRVLPPAEDPAPIATLRQALAARLPAAGSLPAALDLLSGLAHPPPPTAGTAVPAAASGVPAAAARALLSALPTPAQVATGEGLRAAVADSGIFLEARLAALAPGQPAPPNDLKAHLLRLANLLPRATAPAEALATPPPSPSVASDHNAAGWPRPPPAVPSPASPPAADSHAFPPAAALRAERPAARPPDGGIGSLSPAATPAAEPGRAGAEAEAALARIELNQLRAVPRAEAPPAGWLVEVPVRTEDRQDLLTLRIEPDPRTDPDGRPRAWAVTLALDLAELGPIQARVGWQDRALTTTLWAERPETLARLRGHSGELADALRAAGLDPGPICCLPGPGPDPRPPPLPDMLLDLRA